MRTPIPEAVYDAALRLITRDDRPADLEQLERWYTEETRLTHREIALEVMRQVGERGRN